MIKLRKGENTMKNITSDVLGAPQIVDWSAFQGDLDALRVR